MPRFLFALLIFLMPTILIAQVRVSKLVIKQNQTYRLLESDIIVADTLIMMDSSRIELNKLKQENYIRAQVAIFGKHCVIDGRGINGVKGRSGKSGTTPLGPCSDGASGRDGGKGLDGTRGINLFLYLEEVNFQGVLLIDLTGGNGGEGGNGGNGGGGSPGTVHCNGGNGGNGGNAGASGNGADGGNLMLSCTKHPSFRTWIGTNIKLRSEGGLPGTKGIEGYQGPAGLGPSRKNGKNGTPGRAGVNGLPGAKGEVNFE
jgi:hypothetical protein